MWYCVYSFSYKLGVEKLEIVNIHNVTFNYTDSSKSAIEDINLKINEGEFVLITGPSGCGKSTLIRLINGIIPDYYGGTIKGEVFLQGNNIVNIDRHSIVKMVGMVYQHPEKQIILQDVEREIAFGLENFNTEINTMKRNVAEAISLLGINGIRDKQTAKISGGEKQRVAIAAIAAMDPEIILLDEPISQLDPIGAEEVLNYIKKLNCDMGKTIVLVEQRLDKCFSMADRIIFMENGRIINEGTPHNIPKEINKKHHIPNLTYIFKSAGYEKLPIDVKEARKIVMSKSISTIDKQKKSLSNVVVEVKKLNFGYEKRVSTLKDINLTIRKGEILCVMGENGAGKSTLFKIIAGLINNYTGKVYIEGKNASAMDDVERIKKVGYLSQNPNDYFGRKTVFEEVGYTLKNIDEYSSERVNEVLNLMNITHLKDRNPRDLSGGEKQRTAIACTLVANPDILVLDEPTRGMDSIAKDNLGNIIRELASRGKSIVIITHDADFAGDYGDTVNLMFDGEIVARGDAESILCDSAYYSPQVSRVFKNRSKVVCSKDAIKLLRESK